MTKAQAFHDFWNSFGVIAYEENSVPKTADGATRPEFPYITYQYISDSSFNSANTVASIWGYSTSWEWLNDKADEISQHLGLSGKLLMCDNGALWVRRGSPFAESMGDDSNRFIKRKILNVSIEFLTMF